MIVKLSLEHHVIVKRYEMQTGHDSICNRTEDFNCESKVRRVSLHENDDSRDILFGISKKCEHISKKNRNNRHRGRLYGDR